MTFSVCNHLAEEERAGRFRVVLSMLCGGPKRTGWYLIVSIPDLCLLPYFSSCHVADSLCSLTAVSDCGILRLYRLVI